MLKATVAPDGAVHIELDPTAKWEVIVDPQGTIAIACLHPGVSDKPEDVDRYLLGVGHMECAGLPAAQFLVEGLSLIRSGGLMPGMTTN